MLSAMASSRRFDDHSFALCYEGRLSAELRAAGAPVSVLPAPRLRRPLQVLRFRAALAGLLSRLQPARVICHGIWSYCLAAAAVRAGGFDPTLFLHDVPEPRKVLYRWGWLRPPRLCIANSEFVRSRVRDLGGAVQTAVVHPLVLTPAQPAPTACAAIRSELGVREGEVVILQASRLDPWKGHRTLLRSLARLDSSVPFRAWIAGAPQRAAEQAYADGLRRMVSELGLEQRVTFIGHRTDMPTVLAACDVYCQPNEHPEPFGMVFVEALLAERPVVCGESGGVREIVDTDCGVACPAEPAVISRELRRLVEDSSLRKRLGAAGAARMQRLFGLEEFARSLDAALV